MISTTTNTNIAARITERSNRFEHSLSIQRETERLEMVLMHLGEKPAVFSVSTVSDDNLDNEPEHEQVLTLQEARALRDLLNRPEVAAYLNTAQ